MAIQQNSLQQTNCLQKQFYAFNFKYFKRLYSFPKNADLCKIEKH